MIRRGLNGDGVIVLSLILLVLLLVMVMHYTEELTGMSAWEQLHEALFVAKDWD